MRSRAPGATFQMWMRHPAGPTCVPLLLCPERGHQAPWREPCLLVTRCPRFRAPHEAAERGTASRPCEQWRPQGAGVAHGGVGARA
eukprot:3623889-Pyramimonas_sp.AAC.1